jgi:hypothetical protein
VKRDEEKEEENSDQKAIKEKKPNVLTHELLASTLSYLMLAP